MRYIVTLACLLSLSACAGYKNKAPYYDRSKTILYSSDFERSGSFIKKAKQLCAEENAKAVFISELKGYTLDRYLTYTCVAE